MQEVEVKVTVRLNRTEDPEKVIQAVSNIAGCGEPSFLEDEWGQTLVFHGSGRESLSPLRRLLFEQRILGAARRVLKRSLKGNMFHFYLNKQAAYSNQASFCEEAGESALGPLSIEVMTREPEALLNWLSPSTR